MAGGIAGEAVRMAHHCQLRPLKMVRMTSTAGVPIR
jgi:hypothetical protein